MNLEQEDTVKEALLRLLAKDNDVRSEIRALVFGGRHASSRQEKAWEKAERKWAEAIAFLSADKAEKEQTIAALIKEKEDLRVALTAEKENIRTALTKERDALTVALEQERAHVVNAHAAREDAVQSLHEERSQWEKEKNAWGEKAEEYKGKLKKTKRVFGRRKRT